MSTTGKLKYSTAFHSVQFSGVIWKRAWNGVSLT
jgi:hypothetical protein